MDGDPVGSGLGEGFQIAVGIFDHQMHVQYPGRYLTRRLDHQRANGDIGDKMPIHDIDMDNLSTGLIHGPDLISQSGKISR